MGFRRIMTPQSAGRVGVARIGDFYARFTGCRGIPESEAAWLRIPEHALAAATSGEVFDDPLGEFTRVREALLPCYPEDVRLKKLAARLFAMAQAGQYNYPRTVKRGDAVAASLALAEFTKAALSALHLLNRRYGALLQVALAQRGGAAEAFRGGARDGGALRTGRRARKSDRIDMRARARGARGAGAVVVGRPVPRRAGRRDDAPHKSEYMRKLSVTAG